jgi:hypothetical protein
VPGDLLTLKSRTRFSLKLERYVVGFVFMVSQALLARLIACVCAVVVVGLLVAALMKRMPIIWIAFGLVAVISLALLFYEHEQLYKDGEPG